jgi:hypothetical protein
MSMISALPFLLVLAMCFVSKSNDMWRMHLTWGVWASVFWISNEVRKKTHWSAALTFLLCTGSAAYVTFYPDSPFKEYGFCSEAAFDTVGAQALAWLTLIVVVTISLSKRQLTLWVEAFCFAGLLSSCIMIIKFFIKLPPDAIFDNPSLDSTFLALTLPFTFYSLRNYTKILLFFLILNVLAIGVSKSHTGMTLLAFESLLYLILTFRRSLVTALAIFSIPLAVLAMQVLIGAEKFGQSSGRTTIWKITLAQFVSLGNYVFGNGSGTFWILSPDAQKLNGITMIFPFVHNEPLQVLFEQGIVGVIFLSILFYYMIKGSKSEKWMLITVLSLGVASLTQPIFRYYPFALFCALICRMSLLSFSDEERT